MKLTVLLFLIFTITSCSFKLTMTEKRIICQAFNELDNCIEEATAEKIATCSNNVTENVIKNLNEVQSIKNKNETHSYKTEEIDYATKAIFRYSGCISDIATAIQKSDPNYREETLDEIKESEWFTKECLTSIVTNGRHIFECN